MSSPTTRPMAMPAHGAFSATPASIKASEPPQTVAMDDEPFDSRMSDTNRMAYGKSASGGSRLLSARSANAQQLNRAHAERWKIVVQHEALELVLRKQQVLALHIFLGTQGQRGQGLRLTASEQRRAVPTWQQTHFPRNVTDWVKCAP